MKLWGGRFQEETAPEVEAFTASIPFDKKLYREDIAGSIAHAQMLAANGIISEDDAAQIKDGLLKILTSIENGEFTFSISLEDIHMNIESALTEAIGDAGKCLHTARSRNDQVALDMHLYMRRAIVETGEALLALLKTLKEVATEYQDVILPGYTHLQRAQPILLAQHLMAYFHMLARDFRRLESCWQSADIMPLGAGALAGTTYPTQPEMVRDAIGFKALYANSMEIGRVYGHFIALATVMKGLPLAYNKDLQEDKEGVFDTVATLGFALRVYADMLRSMKVNRERMRAVLDDDFSNATDMADYLAKRGVPFREAHAIVGKAVHYCIENNKVLTDLTLSEFKAWSPAFDEDILDAISIEACIAARDTHGGTAPARVARQLEGAAKLLAVYEKIQAERADKAILPLA